ncbi:MAG: T9SS type A sorting domain-containing protein, partial [Aliifodinibius sp.]|nr:T9SS type A sorting domain-containing protein [Fodinibius sp.]NIV15395.1 T9SS type A sorting domain-containing protein [Fodinibius sp.]NIY29256.1 T9SS type A sorting domain-containing protein [Fodinibius sp.]
MGLTGDDTLPTQYYTFEQVYKMLLFEVSKEELILRLPNELKFLYISASKEAWKQIMLTKPLAKSIKRFAAELQSEVSEPYVIQGIDEFISYINTSIGKSFYQIYKEVTDQPIARLNKVTDEAASDELTPATEVDTFTLMGNYPNPFNPGTTIEYSLPQDSHVKVVVYNTLGQEIATLVNERQKRGINKVQWEGKNSQGQPVPSGNYFYRFEINGQIKATEKMVLVK